MSFSEWWEDSGCGCWLTIMVVVIVFFTILGLFGCLPEYGTPGYQWTVNKHSASCGLEPIGETVDEAIEDAYKRWPDNIKDIDVVGGRGGAGIVVHFKHPISEDTGHSTQ